MSIARHKKTVWKWIWKDIEASNRELDGYTDSFSIGNFKVSVTVKAIDRPAEISISKSKFEYLVSILLGAVLIGYFALASCFL